MKMYHHVICFVSNNDIGMCHCIIEEISDGIIFSLCWFGLLFFDVVELCDHGEVNVPGIVKTCSKNMLDLVFKLL